MGDKVCTNDKVVAFRKAFAVMIKEFTDEPPYVQPECIEEENGESLVGQCVHVHSVRIDLELRYSKYGLPYLGLAVATFESVQLVTAYHVINCLDGEVRLEPYPNNQEWPASFDDFGRLLTAPCDWANAAEASRIENDPLLMILLEMSLN